MTAQELIEKLLELPPDTKIVVSKHMVYKDVEDVEPIEDTEEEGQILFYAIK